MGLRHQTPAWMVANQMGPHPLWLLESLLEHMSIEPGKRVIDLGCGTAPTSIFLAREFGARLDAVDGPFPPRDLGGGK